MNKILAVALLAACATTAWAQKSPTGNIGFDNLDKNRDGYLSREEIAADKELAKRYTKFDADKDKRWTLDDYIKAHRENDSRIAADSAITTKVKASLLGEKGVPSTAISVTTYEAKVTLTGTVDNVAMKDTAGKVAAGVSGVKAVDNKIAVKGK